MDNGDFRAQHQIFSHLFLGFEETAAATSLLVLRSGFWQIESHETLISHSQKGVQCCFADCCLAFWRLLDDHRSSWAQPLGKTWQRAGDPSTDIHVASRCTANQTWQISCKSCSTKHSPCWSKVTSSSASVFHQQLSYLVAMLDITHLGYMKKHVTTTLPKERLKPEGIQDSWMEKWNNTVRWFYLQVKR